MDGETPTDEVPRDDVARRLRELHDDYAWEINAAIGEGLDHLVQRLADAYLDDALRLMTESGPSDCGHPDCAICSGAQSAFPRPTRRPWPLRRLLEKLTGRGRR